MTPQRQAIFAHLAGNRSHPTAEEIHRAVRRQHRGLSLATVYNTIETLHALGEVARHDLGSAAVRFDPEVRPHHHFICARWGGIEDVFTELPLALLAGPPGARVDSVELRLAGVCRDCQALEP